MWVLEGAELTGLSVSREPGSVISGCLAEIDPIAPAVDGKGFPLMRALTSRWRTGLNRFEDIHETARLRFAASADYRPPLLTPYADRIMDSVRHRQAA